MLISHRDEKLWRDFLPWFQAAWFFQSESRNGLLIQFKACPLPRGTFFDLLGWQADRYLNQLTSEANAIKVRTAAQPRMAIHQLCHSWIGFPRLHLLLSTYRPRPVVLESFRSLSLPPRRLSPFAAKPVGNLPSQKWFSGSVEKREISGEISVPIQSSRDYSQTLLVISLITSTPFIHNVDFFPSCSVR